MRKFLFFILVVGCSSAGFSSTKLKYNLAAIEALQLSAGGAPVSVTFKRTDGVKASCPVKLAIAIEGEVEKNGNTAGYFDQVSIKVGSETKSAFAGDSKGSPASLSDPYVGVTKRGSVQVSVMDGQDITLEYLTRNNYWNNGKAKITSVTVLDEACGSCAPGAGDCANKCVYLKINLGRGNTGEALPGMLQLQVDAPSTAAYSPASLTLVSGLYQQTESERMLAASQTPSMVVISSGGTPWIVGETLRQVVTSTSFFDIVPIISGVSYEVRSYDRSRMGTRGTDGLYAVVGEASDTLYTWVIENPETAATPANQKVKITKKTGANSLVNLFTWSTADADWILSKGSGSEMITERRVKTVVGAVTTETLVTTNSDNQVVSEEAEVTTAFSFGSLVTETSVGSGSEKLATTYEYWPAGSTGTRVGQLKKITYPNGHWEYYNEYDTQGRVTQKVVQYLNHPYTGNWPDAINRVSIIENGVLTEVLKQQFAIGLGDFLAVSRDTTGHGWQNPSQGYASCNGFGASGPLDSWLISRAVDISSAENPTFRFLSDRDFNGGSLQVYVSTNYSGTGDPLASGVLWTEITSSFVLTNTDWKTSIKFDLSPYRSASTRVAFRYKSSSPATGGAALWKIDDVIIGADEEYSEKTIEKLEDRVIGVSWNIKAAPLDERSVVGQNLTERWEVSATATDLSSLTASTDLSAYTSSNRITRNYFYPQDAVFPGVANMPSRAVATDGRLTFYTYGRAADGGLITNTLTGNANTAGTAVAEGYLTVETESAQGQLVSSFKYYVKTGQANLLIESMEASSFDDLGRPRSFAYGDGSLVTRTFACCGIDSETDREGMTKQYRYDTFGRLYRTEIWAGSVMQSAVEYKLDALGRQVKQTQIGEIIAGAAAPSRVVREAGYLTNGDLAWEKDALGRTINHTTERNATGGYTLTKQTMPGLPSLHANITTSYQDGSTYKEGGLATRPMQYAYSVEVIPDTPTGYMAVTTAITPDDAGNVTMDSSGFPTTEFTAQGSGPSGAFSFTRRPAADGGGVVLAKSWRGPSGDVVKAVDFNGVTTFASSGLFSSLRVLDVNGNGTAGDGNDSGARTTHSYLTGHGTTVLRQITEVRVTGGTWQEISRDEQEVIDVNTNGVERWSSQYLSPTYSVESINRSERKRLMRVDRPEQFSDNVLYVNGRPEESYRVTAGETLPARKVVTHYDGLGRVAQSSDSVLGNSDLTYSADDRVQTYLSPDPDPTKTGAGYDRQLTSYTYTLQSDANELTETTLPGGGVQKSLSNPLGQQVKSWGRDGYPQAMTYTPAGQMATLTTWQAFDQSDGTGTSGAAVTAWLYNRAGLLQQKHYNFQGVDPAHPGHYLSSPGPSYTYTAGGLLLTRSRPRSGSDTELLVTTYNYDDGAAGEGKSGRLIGINYGAGAGTSNVVYTYDLLGRIETIQDDSGTRQNVYENGMLKKVAYLTGMLSGVEVVKDYNWTQGSSLKTVSAGFNGHDPFQSAYYAYDHTFGRLSNIQVGDDVFTYDYRADLPQPTLLTYLKNDSDLAFNQEWVRDNLGRESKLKFTHGSSAAPQIGYQVERQYDHRGRAHWDVLGGDRKWKYEYDDLGQVKVAQKQLAAGTVLPGYDFGYSFDSIGNRTRATVNGRDDDYTPNLLNQYEEREVSGAVDVRGSAATTAYVLVNDALAIPGAPPRSTPEFFKAVEVGNTSEPVVENVKIQAVDSTFSPAKVATQTRQAYVAQTPEVFEYDLNGNLKKDGRWLYSWDAENRLKSIEPIGPAAAAGASHDRFSYVYDSEGRRVSKIQEVWDDGAEEYEWSSQTLFVWDGWLLVAEISLINDGVLVPAVGHTWGPDISGSRTSTGGVGGLVHVSKFTTEEAYTPAYGANGNIVAYVNLDNMQVASRSEYGPFGELVQSGSSVPVFPFGFSTKYLDVESGLNYYGFRYYNPNAGRWLNRDPWDEYGGLNLYGFVLNNPLYYFDSDGRGVSSLDSPTGVAVMADLESQAVMQQAAREGATILAREAAARAAAIAAAAAATATIPGDSCPTCPNNNTQPNTPPIPVVAPTPTPSSQLTPDQIRQKSEERKAYKRRCTEFSPPGLDKCARLRWLLQRNKDCKRMREEFGRKWFGDNEPNHLNEIRNLETAIKNLEENIKKECTPCPAQNLPTP